VKKSRREFFKESGSYLAAATVLANLPPKATAATRRPNFLFFYPDQHRHDWLAANPEIPVPTPNLARLAASGVNFTRAFTPSPVCAPARACLATGREYDRCRVASNRYDLPLDSPTYYRSLRDSGYQVLGCGKLDLHKASKGWGLDGKRSIREWGFSDAIDNCGKGDGMVSYLIEEPIGPKDPYYAFLDAQRPPLGRACADDLAFRYTDREHRLWGYTGTSPLDDEHYCDNWLARNGLALLDAVPRNEPWHLVVNFVGPHPPMDITTRMDRLYRGPERVIDGFPQPHDYEGPFDERLNLRIRQNYAAMIENIDRWLGIYLDKLAERGELDNTIIVYSSDHGEMLGDHGRWGKSIPFQPSVGVPLLMAGPGIRQGLSSDALVSVMDLTATFLDYGGLSIPADMDSRSLRPLLEGATQEHRDHVLSGLGDWRLVFDGRYKLVEGFGGESLLYDLEEDPFEDVNVAASFPAVVRRLGDALPERAYEEAPADSSSRARILRELSPPKRE
jgi:arylsulfatase A-like enzyme